MGEGLAARSRFVIDRYCKTDEFLRACATGFGPVESVGQIGCYRWSGSAKIGMAKRAFVVTDSLKVRRRVCIDTADSLDFGVLLDPMLRRSCCFAPTSSQNVCCVFTACQVPSRLLLQYRLGDSQGCLSLIDRLAADESTLATKQCSPARLAIPVDSWNHLNRNFNRR